jgi:PAS domain S-box-containing protein
MRDSAPLSISELERLFGGDCEMARALVENSNDFIGLASLDGRAVFVNPAGRRLVGLGGVDDAQVFSVADYVIAADCDKLLCEVLPTAVREGRWDGEIRFRHFRTGAAIPMLQQVFLIKETETGRPLAFATISRDITARKQAGEQLRESEHRFCELAESIPHHVRSFRRDGTVSYWNQRWPDYTGLAQEALEQGGWGAVHPEDAGVAKASWQEALAQGTAFEAELRVRGREGTYRRFLCRAEVVRDPQGRPVEWFCTDTDIEERRQAQDALKSAHAELEHVTRISMLGELTASIAHEINQPLGAILNNGYVGLRIAAAGSGSPGRLQELLSAIVQDANRAGEIISRIGTMTKRTAPNKSLLELRVVITDVLALADCELAERGIDVRNEIPEDLPRIPGDRVQLQQVFLNLVMNAVEAMSNLEPGQRVLLITARPDELTGQPAVRISVRDSGRGFRSQDCERLFDAFYTTKPNGMGMGLRISRSIVEAHGGRLWGAPNTGPGATFTCLFPVENGTY